MNSMQYFDMTERDSINHLIKYTVIHSLINIVCVKTHCLLCAAVRLMQGKGRDTEGSR